MFMDILIALAITVVAIALGATVHPFLFFLVALAIVFLVARHRAHGPGYRAY